MGAQHINIRQSEPVRKRSGFRYIFIRYVLGILLITFILSCGLELAGVFLVALSVQSSSIFTHNRALQVLVILLLVAIPVLVLVIVTLFFTGRLERKIRQPVDELMLAVEKIRQQDLNFSIHYQGRNELGDLCYAFNELRHELQESLEREWRKQEEMRMIIATLSHDLRTPVTIIQGHIEGLARIEAGEKRNERLDRYLPILESSSQRMARLLNDILLVSSLEQVSFVIHPEDVCLEKEMERKAQIYELQATTQEITFVYTYHNLDTHTECISIDLHRIEQVLDNLFENALHYTPTLGNITLVCTHQPQHLSFVLCDTGCGIAPEHLPCIFEKFYQGKRPDNKARKGVGLGLYTCKLLIEKQGGTIAIRNCVAGGCEVSIYLPLENKETKPEKQTASYGSWGSFGE